MLHNPDTHTSQPTYTWTKHTNIISKHQVVEQDFTNVTLSFDVVWFNGHVIQIYSKQVLLSFLEVVSQTKH